jgi:hypothetical protein
MTDRRALLTDREREIISGEAEVSDSYRYQTISRIRARLDRLAGDLEALEAHGALADELRDRVCGTPPTTTQPPRDEREAVETPSKPKPDESDEAGDETRETPASGDEHDALNDVVEKVADGWEDHPERLADRKQAALAVLEYAREHGSVSKQEAKEEIEPEHPVEGQQPDTWYRKNIRPVLDEAGEYDPGTHGYRITLDGGGE